VQVASARSRVERLPAILWISLTALVLWAVYGTGYVAYDGMYSLVWGADLAHGQQPDLEVPVAPTPHPLANLMGALLSPFGDGAPAILLGAVMLSFGLVGWAAVGLGRALFSWPVGLGFAFVLLTRELLVNEALQASIDIPFLALVLWAAALEARKPRRGAAVLVLLGLAGLLRPEAWFLAAVYWFYLWPQATSKRRTALALLAASAPLLWASFDLVVTGDPLFSLHGTQDLAAELDRPRRVGVAFEAMPV
jgi:hypothetical protein